jgi:hypothetical protein
MPLTSPGGSVDLISEVLVTLPRSSVIFTSLDINRDRAYTIEFEIVPDYTSGVGEFPATVNPQANGLIVAGANYNLVATDCNFDCDLSIFEANFNAVDLMFGTFTFRRLNVSNFLCGNFNGSTYNAGAFVQVGSGSWNVFPTLFANVASVGIEVGNINNDFIGVGSVFRLYKGSG